MATAKPMTRVSRRVARVLDRLSKNTIADMLADIVIGEIGEDATDEQILSRLQGTLDVVLRLRNDRPLSLLNVMEAWDEADAEYRRKHNLK